MQMTSVMASLSRACEWIWRLAYINLLWILFTTLGLILFGIAPATFAMFAVIRKWVMGEEEINVFQTFWKSYRSDFWKTNLLGWILIIGGFILYIDFLFIGNFQGGYATLLSGLLILLSILYLVICVYIFPVFSHYELKFFQYIKYAVHIGITSPLSTILIGICALAVYYVVAFIPGITPFFSVSVLSYIIMRLAYHSFCKVERKYTSYIEEA
ncbi:YesL family protein [Sporosarcina sp. FSL K6-3457]|uniref:YesL family protein n=1 Tax=Sporosarcina sp. FSL K6-3457 TaxID=2978204 RepID=UPI0030F50768